MKWLAALLLAVVALAAGCKPADQNTSSVDASTNAVASQKDQALAAMRDEISKLQEQASALGQEIKLGSEKLKADAQPKLDALKAKIADLSKQLDAAKDTSASKWDAFKSGFEKASQDAKSSLMQAEAWVSEKVSPAASTR